MKIDVNANIMELNDAYAAKNRELFASDRMLTINIMGSPGAGKTTLLERLISDLQGKLNIAVIEGDLATAKDAKRIADCGCSVIQINTDGGCHLDAKMIDRVLPGFDLDAVDLLIIENVGNLVCPAGFDLGEDIRMVVLSVTEGDDKPAKYPGAFLAADWVVLNKMDLLEFTDFSTEKAFADMHSINPALSTFPVCCREGHVSGVTTLAEAIMTAVAKKVGK